MCEEGDDILVDIPDEELPELMEVYKQHLDTAFDAYCAIDNGIKWRQKTRDDSMMFLSPNQSWRQDGTFILLMRLSDSAYDIFVYTLDDESTSLSRGLRETRRIDYRGGSRVLFFSVHDPQLELVRELAQSKATSPLFVVDTQIFYLPIELALHFDVKVPEGLRLGPLRPEHASIMDACWTHRYYGSKQTLERLIEVNGGLGLYEEDGDGREPVAWMVLGWLGQMVLLQVAEGHHRRGYAAVLIRAMARDIAAGGQVPYGTIVTRNTAAVALLRKLGFRTADFTHFLSYRHQV